MAYAHQAVSAHQGDKCLCHWWADRNHVLSIVFFLKQSQSATHMDAPNRKKCEENATPLDDYSGLDFCLCAIGNIAKRTNLHRSP